MPAAQDCFICEKVGYAIYCWPCKKKLPLPPNAGATLHMDDRTKFYEGFNSGQRWGESVSAVRIEALQTALLCTKPRGSCRLCDIHICYYKKKPPGERKGRRRMGLHGNTRNGVGKTPTSHSSAPRPSQRRGARRGDDG